MRRRALQIAAQYLRAGRSGAVQGARTVLPATEAAAAPSKPALWRSTRNACAAAGVVGGVSAAAAAAAAAGSLPRTLLPGMAGDVRRFRAPAASSNNAGGSVSIAEALYGASGDVPVSELLPKIEASTPEELTSGAGAAAMTGYDHPDFLRALASSVVGKMGELTPPQLTAIAMAFAELRFYDMAFKDALADAVMARLHEFEGHGLGRVVRTFGQLEYRDDELLESVATHCIKNMEKLDADDVANVVYAYAAVGYHHPELLQAVDDFLSEQQLEPKVMVALVDAFSRLGLHWADIIPVVAEYLEGHADEFDPRSLPVLVSALARAGYADADVYNAVAPALAANLDTYSAKDVTKVITAYAAVGVCPTALFDRVADEIMPARIAEFSPNGLDDMLRACTKSGYSNTRLIKLISERLGAGAEWPQSFQPGEVYKYTAAE